MRQLLLIALLLFPGTAFAGAWTMPRGQTQIIAQTDWSKASASFDSSGVASQPVAFEKILSNIDIEYGWNRWLTLIAVPEFAHARTLRPGGVVETDDDWAGSAGVRMRLAHSFGVLSTEFTAKSAGAYAMSVSRDRAPGRQLEWRLLYGTNFMFFHRRGYIDIEGGYRWIAGPRADEFPLDVTLGYQLDRRTGILLQSFNIITAGDARPPYQYYRLHKIELSTVTRWSSHVSIQSGAFISPAGQNSLEEKGVCMALWLHF